MGLVALRCYARAWFLLGRAAGGDELARGEAWRAGLVAVLGVAATLRFVLSDLGHGQVNLLVVGLTLEGVALAESGQERRGGLCLALAVLFKLTPAIVVLGYLLAGRRRLVGWTLGAGAALAALPTLVLGLGGHATALHRFVAVVTPWNAAQHAYVGNNVALGSLLQRLVTGVADAGRAPRPLLLDADPALAGALAAGAGAAVLAAATGWAWRSARGRRDPVHRTAVLLACVPLVSPVAWKPHLVVLILPAFVAARALIRPGAGRRPAGALLAVGLALGALTSRFFAGARASDLLTLWGAPTAGVALLALGLVLAPAGDRDEDLGPAPSPPDRGGSTAEVAEDATARGPGARAA